MYTSVCKECKDAFASCKATALRVMNFWFVKGFGYLTFGVFGESKSSYTLVGQASCICE